MQFSKIETTAHGYVSRVHNEGRKLFVRCINIQRMEREFHRRKDVSADAFE
jgi:hypothetical protein